MDKDDLCELRLLSVLFSFFQPSLCPLYRTSLLTSFLPPPQILGGCIVITIGAGLIKLAISTLMKDRNNDAATEAKTKAAQELMQEIENNGGLLPRSLQFGIQQLTCQFYDETTHGIPILSRTPSMQSTPRTSQVNLYDLYKHPGDQSSGSLQPSVFPNSRPLTGRVSPCPAGSYTNLSETFRQSGTGNVPTETGQLGRQFRPDPSSNEYFSPSPV